MRFEHTEREDMLSRSLKRAVGGLFRTVSGQGALTLTR